MQVDNTQIELLGLLAQAEKIRGKTRFQKLLYFLQEGEGVRLGLNFRMHHYGPYCPTLEVYLQTLQLQDLVEVDAEFDGPVVIDISPKGRELGERSAYGEAARHLLKNLGAKLPSQLELLATVHYLAKATGYDVSDPARERLIQAVKTWKQGKFTVREIGEAVDELTQLRYLS